MRKVKFLAMWLLVVLALSIPSIALADNPPPLPPSRHPDVPQCIDMPSAQVPGTKPGTACQLPVASLSADLSPALSYGRSGSTNRYTSRTDSGLIENQTKVEGYLLYWAYWIELWQLDDTCEQQHLDSSHALCSTSGGPSGLQLGQQGYHYWINSIYGNDSLGTWDTWWN